MKPERATLPRLLTRTTSLVAGLPVMVAPVANAAYSSCSKAQTAVRAPPEDTGATFPASLAGFSTTTKTRGDSERYE